MEQQQTSRSNVLLQYGLISGLVSLLFFVFLYIMGTEAFVNFVYTTIAFLIPIVFCVMACRKARSENGGYLEFKEALKISFGVLVITALITSLFTYILFNFIDTGFKERMTQVAIEKSQQMMERFGAPQEQIDAAMKELMQKDLYSIGNVIQNFLTFCIVYFIIAAIIAAIMKKKKPEFAA